MSFNESNMKVLHTVEGETDDGRGTIFVELFTWKDGPPKVKLTRKVDPRDENDAGFRKLGGVTLAEAEIVIDGIGECLVEASKLSAKDAGDETKRKTKTTKAAGKKQRRV